MRRAGPGGSVAGFLVALKSSGTSWWSLTAVERRWRFVAAAAMSFSDDPALVGRYLELLPILDHVADGLRLPSVECRVGGYELAAETRLVPFEDLDEYWGNYGAYQRCVTGTIALSRDALYDKPIGVKVGVLDRIRRLFKP